MPSPAEAHWATSAAAQQQRQQQQGPQHLKAGGAKQQQATNSGGGSADSGSSDTSSGSSTCTIAAAAALCPRWKHAQGPGLGLINLGNSCFLNSVLQSLAYLPPLAHLCLERTHGRVCTLPSGSCTACKLETQVLRLLTRSGGGGGFGFGGGSGADTPDALHRALPVVNRSFVRGRQEDAHEYLRCLVDALERDLLRLEGRWAPGGPRAQCPGTLVNVLFQGAVVNSVTCLACGHVSNTWDPVQDLSLEINGALTVEDALRRYTAPEHLDGANAYRCDGCRRLVPARKQMAIYDDPNVLVIHLKRFDGFLGGKIGGYVRYGDTLDLQPFLAPPKLVGARRWQTRGGSGAAAGDAVAAAADCGPSVYRLTGVLCHAGSTANSGHYFSFVRDGVPPHGSWWCANDSSFYRVSAQHALSQSAYLLFYVRDTMKPLAELPRAVDAGPSAAAAGPPQAKRAPGLIGPQLPPELATKRARLAGPEEGNEEGNGAHVGPIGPALPPGWTGRQSSEGGGDGSDAVSPRVASASTAGPNPFSRYAMGPVAAVPAANAARRGTAGTTRIGPPLRHINVTLRPKQQPQQQHGSQQLQQGPSPRTQQQQQPSPRAPQQQPSRPSRPAEPPPPQSPRLQQPPQQHPASSQQQQPVSPQQQHHHHRNNKNQQQRPAAAAAAAAAAGPVPSGDPALAAVRKATAASLMDTLRAVPSVMQTLLDAARARYAAGLPLIRPSEMPAAERLPLQRAVGLAGGNQTGYALLSGALRGEEIPELAPWRDRVEREALAEAAAAGGDGG